MIHRRETQHFSGKFYRLACKKLPFLYGQYWYWIVQEALNNILKHAQADEVAVYLRREGGQITLEISDNGIGFDPNHLPHGEGMGLSNMRTRAEKIGGTLKIKSQKEKGTIITVSGIGIK